MPKVVTRKTRSHGSHTNPLYSSSSSVASYPVSSTLSSKLAAKTQSSCASLETPITSFADLLNPSTTATPPPSLTSSLISISTSKPPQQIDNVPAISISPETAAAAALLDANKKKERREMRKLLWLEKLNGAYTARSKETAKKLKRSQVGTVGDLDDIKNALPLSFPSFNNNNSNRKMGVTSGTLGSGMDMDEDAWGLPSTTATKTAPASSVQQQTQPPSKAKPGKQKPISQSARRQQGLEEILRLQNVLKHQSFKTNPMETIRAHVQNNLHA
ncbi:hypothetical protein HDV05_002922 [Chytridiales sp. JEL 0842]|nr:hypothetical protein HDV05_002922 [Chytridiales sp. JEL 0842]